MAHFLQITFETNKIEAELTSDCLTEWGALAVTLLDAKDTPLFEPKLGTAPLWNDTKVVALFEEKTNTQSLKKQLKDLLTESSINTLSFEILEDEDWVRKSLDQFKPQSFADKLWICPSWCEISDRAEQEKKGTVFVTLDPGLAFGTGTHPTTQLCLEWLAAHSLLGKTVIDYGCGSGILGIAAVKLGASQVFSVDHDPQALASTKDNAKLNEISTQRFTTYLPQEFQGKEKADVLIANILSLPLIELAPLFMTVVKPEGYIVLSGILEEQCSSVLQAYQQGQSIEHFEVTRKDGWVLIEFIKSKR